MMRESWLRAPQHHNIFDVPYLTNSFFSALVSHLLKNLLSDLYNAPSLPVHFPNLPICLVLSVLHISEQNEGVLSRT